MEIVVPENEFLPLLKSIDYLTVLVEDSETRKAFRQEVNCGVQ